MAQRVVIGTCLLLTIVSLAMVGLFWQYSIQAQRLAARESAEAARFMASMNESAQARDREMIQQLQRISAAMQNPRSPDWNPLSFKFTEETPGGPPAAGCVVSLTKWGENQNGGINQSSDASGVADFGLVSPGNYSYSISRNWSGGRYVAQSDRLVISPGSQTKRTLVCPKAPPDMVAVRILFPWPDDLKTQGLVCAASFWHDGREFAHGLHWTLFDDGFGIAPSLRPTRGASILRGTASRIRTVQFGGMGGMGGIGGQSAMTGFRFGSVTRTAIVGPDAKSSYGILKGKALYFFQQSDEAAEFEIAADILGEDLRAASSPTATVSWEPGVYHLNTIVVMRPAPPVAQTPDSRKRFGVISACSSFGAAFTTIGQPTLHRIGPPTTTQLENPDADAPTRIPRLELGRNSDPGPGGVLDDPVKSVRDPRRPEERMDHPPARATRQSCS